MKNKIIRAAIVVFFFAALAAPSRAAFKPSSFESNSASSQDSSQEQAEAKLRQYCLKNGFYSDDWRSTDFRTISSSNGIYTIEAYDLQMEKRVGLWRVDSRSWAISQIGQPARVAPTQVAGQSPSGAYVRYGVPAPPAGARFSRINSYQGGFTKLEAWTNPSGWTGAQVFSFYKNALEQMGWKLSHQDARMLWAEWVLLDTGKRFPSIDKQCVARVFTLRVSTSYYEINYDELSAPPQQQQVLAEIYSINQDPGLSSVQRRQKLRVAQDTLGQKVFVGALRYSPWKGKGRYI